MYTVNSFELRAQVLQPDVANSSSNFYDMVEVDQVPIDLEVWIDGCQMQQGVAVDFLALLDTIRKLRQSVWKPYWGPNIYSCGCGVPGCAGISDAVQVEHDGAHVIWHARLPLVEKQRSVEHPNGVDTTFRFLKSQMVEQCTNFVQTARKVSGGKLSRIRVPVQKESLDFLLRTSRYKWTRKGVAA